MNGHILLRPVLLMTQVQGSNIVIHRQICMWRRRTFVLVWGIIRLWKTEPEGFATVRNCMQTTPAEMRMVALRGREKYKPTIKISLKAEPLGNCIIAARLGIFMYVRLLERERCAVIMFVSWCEICLLYVPLV